MATRAVHVKLSQRMDLSVRFSEQLLMCCFASVLVLKKEKNLLWFSGLLAAYEWRCNGWVTHEMIGWMVGEGGKCMPDGKVAMILL